MRCEAWTFRKPFGHGLLRPRTIRGATAEAGAPVSGQWFTVTPSLGIPGPEKSGADVGVVWDGLLVQIDSASKKSHSLTKVFCEKALSKCPGSVKISNLSGSLWFSESFKSQFDPENLYFLESSLPTPRLRVQFA